MAHMKRIAIPKTWPLPRKGSVFVAKPMPGRKLEECLPLGIVIKLLEYVQTAKEVKFVLNSGKVLVNGKVCKESKFPVGLFDVISFLSAGKHFRMLFKKKKLFLHEIQEDESKIGLAKVTGKKILKGKKVQINLSNGDNMFGNYSIGSTVVFSGGKVSDSFELEEGVVAYITSGKHVGKAGKISDAGKEIVVEIAGKSAHVPKEKIIVIGKEKPIISLPKEGEGESEFRR